MFQVILENQKNLEVIGSLEVSNNLQIIDDTIEIYNVDINTILKE